MRGKDGRNRGPSFVYVLNYVQGLTDADVAMDEDRYFLVDGIGLDKKLALGVKNIRFVQILVLDRFQV
jgi:hypothetical protein